MTDMKKDMKDAIRYALVFGAINMAKACNNCCGNKGKSGNSEEDNRRKSQTPGSDIPGLGGGRRTGADMVRDAEKHIEEMNQKRKKRIDEENKRKLEADRLRQQEEEKFKKELESQKKNEEEETKRRQKRDAFWIKINKINLINDLKKIESTVEQDMRYLYDQRLDMLKIQAEKPESREFKLNNAKTNAETEYRKMNIEELANELDAINNRNYSGKFKVTIDDDFKQIPNKIFEEKNKEELETLKEKLKNITLEEIEEKTKETTSELSYNSWKEGRKLVQEKYNELLKAGYEKAKKEREESAKKAEEERIKSAEEHKQRLKEEEERHKAEMEALNKINKETLQEMEKNHQEKMKQIEKTFEAIKEYEEQQQKEIYQKLFEICIQIYNEHHTELPDYFQYTINNLIYTYNNSTDANIKDFAENIYCYLISTGDPNIVKTVIDKNKEIVKL